MTGKFGRYRRRSRGVDPAQPLFWTTVFETGHARRWADVPGDGLGERDSRCHSQGHTHPHWALGEPVNDCSSGSTYVLLHHIRQFYRRASLGARGCLIEATHAPAQACFGVG